MSEEISLDSSALIYLILMFETIFLYVLLHRVSTHSHITESVAFK